MAGSTRREDFGNIGAWGAARARVSETGEAGSGGDNLGTT